MTDDETTAAMEANVAAGWMEKFTNGDEKPLYRLTAAGAKRAELMFDPRTQTVARLLLDHYTSEYDNSFDWTEFREQAIELLTAADLVDWRRKDELAAVSGVPAQPKETPR